MNNTIKISVNKQNIKNIYQEIRKVIKKFYLIEYKTINFSEENENKTYGINKSLFTHFKDGN